MIDKVQGAKNSCLKQMIKLDNVKVPFPQINKKTEC